MNFLIIGFIAGMMLTAVAAVFTFLHAPERPEPILVKKISRSNSCNLCKGSGILHREIGWDACGCK